uniref:Uncharacterized protein n=1 Tax=Arabidopsis thaliana TaxID=3702 RepID=Q570G4_ARATH|nr:hypothetical protein [Arabidopsis thaliana]
MRVSAAVYSSSNSAAMATVIMMI